MGILKSATTQTVQMNSNNNYIGAPSFKYQNPGYSVLNCYNSDAYASVYPSVKSIAYEFKKIRPFAINANGKPVKSTILNALYHPNQTDSSVAFFEKLAVMNLTHRKTYLLVWRKDGNEAKPGGDLNSNNIAGFTFLEAPGITRRDKKTFYNVGSQEFTENEVMVLPGGVDPNDLYAGYAAGEASRAWATLDDYIADYQKGFFENGAVPAGQFIITASSKQDYQDTVDTMQSKHRGAGQNNNVTYTPRPIDPQTGKPGDSKIEWLPFASTNKEIDFKNLFDQANKRIDSAYGVPASIRGVGENNNYATARLDEKNFLLRAVSPLALSIYTQITHELNRITGGIGVAITYELEIPTIADEEKVQAETKSVETNTIIQLVAQGFTLDSIVDSLQLSNSYKLLKIGGGSTKIENDKPEVDEGDEVSKSPDPDKIDGITPLNGAAKRTNPKAELSDEEKLAHVVRKYMSAQIESSIVELDTAENKVRNVIEGVPTAAQEAKFTEEMFTVVASILIANGEITYLQGSNLIKAAGFTTDTLEQYFLSDTTRDSYQAYLKRLGTSYGSDTQAAIQKVAADAVEGGLNEAETRKALRNIMITDEWRVKRLSVTELNRSQQLGGVDSMVQIQAETGATLEKALLHLGSDIPCEFCQTLIGQWTPVEQPLLQLGQSITGADGGIMINNFVENQGYDPHPNGHCVLEYRVVK